MQATITTNDVDTLGQLLAQIADLTKRADAIKDAIKEDASAGGDKVREGELFKATYIETNRSSVDWLNVIGGKLGVKFADKEKAEESWKKVAVKLGFDADEELPSAIANNTKTTAVFSVKVTSK